MFSALSPGQVIVGAGAVASAATIVAQSAVTDGLDPTTGWAGGVIVAGVGVFLFLDRRAQRKEAEVASQRREADGDNKKKIEMLESRLLQEREAHLKTIADMHDRHMTAIEAMNERIIAILRGDSI